MKLANPKAGITSCRIGSFDLSLRATRSSSSACSGKLCDVIGWPNGDGEATGNMDLE